MVKCSPPTDDKQIRLDYAEIRMPYIHLRPDWPKFTWDDVLLLKCLAEVKFKQGCLIGKMEALGFDLKEEAFLNTLTQDILKTSEIEGELLNVEEVRSSLAERLGISIGGLQKSTRSVDGIVEMMLDATRNCKEELSEARLFNWHNSLFAEDKKKNSSIAIGTFRDDKDGPMRVISGAMGRVKIHFEAPEASRLKKETKKFLAWFNQAQDYDLLIKAGIAHLWFVTIYPFDDGNGRISRALADMLLARSDGSSRRFYSMSPQIQAERSDYYKILEESQKGSLDISKWLFWFLDCLSRAITRADTILESVLDKSYFWKNFQQENFNDRQLKMIVKLLDNFEEILTTSKWAKITKCSQDTAHRDILDLIEKGVLRKGEEGGRSTSYVLERFREGS